MTKSTAKLKPREQLFCYYFAQLCNSKEAAIKAGFSKSSAEAHGDSLLMNPIALQTISDLQASRQDSGILQEVISGLKRLAFSSTNDSIRLLLSDKNDVALSLDNLDFFHVAELKMPKENCIEIKFFDRFKAFDKLIELVDKNQNQNQSCEFYSALNASAAEVYDEV